MQELYKLIIQTRKELRAGLRMNADPEERDDAMRGAIETLAIVQKEHDVEKEEYALELLGKVRAAIQRNIDGEDGVVTDWAEESANRVNAIFDMYENAHEKMLKQKQKKAGIKNKTKGE